MSVILLATCCLALLAGPGTLSASTLEVGPGKSFARVEEALAKAAPGDVILIHPQERDGQYDSSALFVDKKNITFRGAAKDGARVKVSGKGYNYSGRGRTPRAILQFVKGADGCVLENLEIFGAHNDDHNGAGVRINQANDVTVRNCDIHNNDMGVMSNGDGTLTTAVNQRFEFCLIHHNGDLGEPGYNHNLYLGGTSVTLFACEVHSPLTGHNVKSRAHLLRAECCYVHHSANREFDLVDNVETAQPGSDVAIVGCIIVKDPKCPGNHAVIHFGRDGRQDRDGTIRVVHCTIVTPFPSSVVELSTAKSRAELVNNIVTGVAGSERGQTLVGCRNGAQEANVTGTRNWLSAGFAPLLPGFPAKENAIGRERPAFDSDWRLPKTPGITGAGETWDKIDLAPLALDPKKPAGKHFTLDWEYDASAGGAHAKPRADGKAPDLGAEACVEKK